MNFLHFQNLYQSTRLKTIRKKAIQRLKYLNNKDDVSSHSYKILIEVVNKKLNALSVNK